MGIELALFILVGSIAIFGAVMMLISENAVHSALFLILNFSAIAFLFLMLDAPFLAMVQITVYTGAIMVLFLFVIMLLGAEKVLTTSRQAISWMVPAAVGVVVTALFLATIIVLESEIETTEPEPTEPLLRIIHANSEVVPVDAYLDGELLASDVRFSEGTEFAEYDAGEYTLGLFPRDADPEDAAPLISEPVFLDEGDVVSLIVMPQAVEDRLILRVDGNLTALEDDKTARLTVVNALPCLAEDGCPITIADITDPDKDPRQFTEGLVYGGIAPVEILRRDEYSDHRYTLAAYEADTLEQATGDDEDTEN
ncbi:MAG: DUF4397 domain-containing protein, partial [Chloroflexi bacterium]|nr:DUF4397 domain-containing protein [Chloroflexota bacterium]